MSGIQKPLNATATELIFFFNVDIGNFEMQLLNKNKYELSSQHKWSGLKDLVKEDMMIYNTWNSILGSYDQLKKLVFAVLSLFGSTY